MSEFTPGPWYSTTQPEHENESSTAHIQSASINENNYVCAVEILDDECAANARLIAAAPDLLAVAYDLVDVISSWRENYPDIHAEELNAAWVAINKVTNN